MAKEVQASAKGWRDKGVVVYAHYGRNSPHDATRNLRTLAQTMRIWKDFLEWISLFQVDVNDSTVIIIDTLGGILSVHSSNAVCCQNKCTGVVTDTTSSPYNFICNFIIINICILSIVIDQLRDPDWNGAWKNGRCYSVLLLVHQNSLLMDTKFT